MTTERLKELIGQLHNVSAWPELRELIDEGIDRSQPDWELPLLACEAVGGEPDQALGAAGAIVCLQRSIMLADDMLDEDPRGVHHHYGFGAAANLALALQATAMESVAAVPLSPNIEVEVLSALAKTAASTAFGQQLDVQNYDDESSYWQVVKAKSTPFYGAALQIGALIGGASAQLSAEIHAAGCLLGEMIQLYDDLKDALEVPANPDWRQGRNNLLIRYALTADHPERETFRTLIRRIDQPGALPRAQEILIRCGGVSFCVYQLVRRHGVATAAIESASLARPTVLRELFDRYLGPVRTLLRKSDAEIPPQLIGA